MSTPVVPLLSSELLHECELELESSFLAYSTAPRRYIKVQGKVADTVQYVPHGV
jgi:hypothetical protein